MDSVLIPAAQYFKFEPYDYSFATNKIQIGQIEGREELQDDPVTHSSIWLAELDDLFRKAKFEKAK